MLDGITHDSILLGGSLLRLVHRLHFDRSVVLWIAGLEIVRSEDDVLVADLWAGLPSRQSEHLHRVRALLQHPVPRLRGERELNGSLLVVRLVCLDLRTNAMAHSRGPGRFQYLHLSRHQLLLALLVALHLLALRACPRILVPPRLRPAISSLRVCLRFPGVLALRLLPSTGGGIVGFRVGRGRIAFLRLDLNVRACSTHCRLPLPFLLEGSGGQVRRSLRLLRGLAATACRYQRPVVLLVPRWLAACALGGKLRTVDPKSIILFLRALIATKESLVLHLQPLRLLVRQGLRLLQRIVWPLDRGVLLLVHHLLLLLPRQSHLALRLLQSRSSSARLTLAMPRLEISGPLLLHVLLLLLRGVR